MSNPSRKLLRTIPSLRKQPFGRPVRSIAFVAVSLCLGNAARAQNSIGDALGKLIAPAVGPVLERAAGEIIVEGVSRGYESGSRFRRPIRRRPSPQPQPAPRNQYQYSPYSQPVEVVQPSYSQAPAPQAPAPPPPQPAAPPQAEIKTVSKVQPPENASPVEIALSHVISDGPGVATGAIRIEAAQITRQLDVAISNYLDQNAGGDQGRSLKSVYRAQLSGKASSDQSVARQSRVDIIGDHSEAFERQTPPSSLVALARAADASAAITAAEGEIDHEQWMIMLDQLGHDLVSVRGSVIGGDELAVMAERVKNMRNLAILSEIGRVLGVQRRKDILQQFHAAADKSEMPPQVSAALVAFPTATPDLAVASMPLPPGNPAVVIYNGQESPGPIRFLCDNELDITLQPGDLAPFAQGFVVAFQNGKGQTKRYSLKRGLFRWVMTDDGWDLKQKTTIRLTIDATHSPTRFHYMINGHPYVATEGETKEHQLTVPPRLDFDTGDRDGTVKSTLLTPGKFFVGANAESGGWDLYQSDQAEVSVPTTASGRAREELVRSIRESEQYSGRLPYRYRVENLLNQLQ